MGFFDFLNKPIPGLNKPSPQMVMDQLKKAVSESSAYARKGDKDNALCRDERMTHIEKSRKEVNQSSMRR